jgi:hypothetical protein
MRRSCYSWDDIKMIYEHPHLLGHLCGKTLLTELHSTWMKYCLYSKEKRGLMAHRGSYKSTCITEVGTILCLMRDPEETIMIVRKAYTLAAEMMREIMNLMESPPIYELLLFTWFANAKGEIPDKAEWHFDIRKEGKLNLSVRKKHTKEPNIMGMGLGGNFVGSHVTRLIFDDATGIDDRLYDAEREFTKMIVAELMSNVINRGYPVTAVSTPWHREDAMAMLESQGVPFKKFPVDTTGLMTPEQIEEVKRNQTEVMYDVNYRLIFTSSGDMLFSSPHKGIWDRRNVKQICAHIDCSFGGADNTALTIAARLPNDKINMVGFLYKGHVKDLLPEIFERMGSYNAHELYIESNGDHGYTLDSILEHPLAKSYAIWGHSYVESTQKQLKIAKVLYDKWLFIQWAEETDSEYLIQICDWTEMSKLHDDAPDSAASLLQQAGFAAGADYMALYR